jgi:hypothetical protein
MTLKKTVLLLCIGFLLTGIGCGKKEGVSNGNGGKNVGGSTLTNVHAPTSGSDSIVFTADSSHLGVMMFCPLGGNNHVVVHDYTTNTDIFNSICTANDSVVTNFTPGDSYTIRCYYGGGPTQSNFTHVSSSYRNSGTTPTPFAGYTQFYNTSAAAGPSDGVAVIIMEQPTMGSTKGK